MEITMNAITKKIHKASLETLKPLIEQFVAEGADKNKIVQTTKRYTESKVKAYYDQIRGLQSIGKGLSSVLNSLLKRADSKAEIVFFHLLQENGIEFQFQYPIGHYRVDYLIGNDLIVELDGPQHIKERDEIRNHYLCKMGYRIIHVPIFIVALSPKAVIEEIRETYK